LLATDAQVRKLHEETSLGEKIETAALRAGMHRNTATKYLKSGRLPQSTEVARPS
jgi:hypothetical protein